MKLITLCALLLISVTILKSQPCNTENLKKDLMNASAEICEKENRKVMNMYTDGKLYGFVSLIGNETEKMVFKDGKWFITTKICMSADNETAINLNVNGEVKEFNAGLNEVRHFVFELDKTGIVEIGAVYTNPDEGGGMLFVQRIVE